MLADFLMWAVFTGVNFAIYGAIRKLNVMRWKRFADSVPPEWCIIIAANEDDAIIAMWKDGALYYDAYFTFEVKNHNYTMWIPVDIKIYGTGVKE